MDFPGGSITNIRVIDGFSNVYWRIYTEENNNNNPSGDTPSNGHTVLKHISRLKELELRLRCHGCLVLSYPRRLGLLIFSATPDFESLSPVRLGDADDSNKVLVGSTVLKVWTSGCVSSADLAKSHRSDLPTVSGNSPAPSQRLQGGSVQPRRVDNSGGAAAIYVSFISAATAAFSLQIIRENNAVPLGPRTLFNTVELEPDGCQSFATNGIASALTSLQVQLTSTGKLTVALQTIAQPGLIRLSQAGVMPSRFAPGTDLWLAPTGSIARLVSVHSYSAPAAEDIGRWKSRVSEWLGYFGLPVDSLSDESWVEVQVWEPFYSKLSGEATRLKEESSSLPLKRILWPVAFCFRRTKYPQLGTFESRKDDSLFLRDPLEFAEEWWPKEIPQSVEARSDLLPEKKEQTSNQNASSPGTVSLPEGIDSLAPASLLPEAQSASLVYPTPPDGTAGLSSNPALPATKIDPDMTMELGPSAGLGVGSGLYDTNDDDDLFGDINEKDFGTKGITDADFSFFDNQEFDRSGKGADSEDLQASPAAIEPSKPVVNLPELEAASPSSTLIKENYIAQDSPAQTQAGYQHIQPITEDNVSMPSPDRDHVQTISPPLSPVEVKKILFPESNTLTLPLAKPAHASSYFNPVAFRNNASSWDKKYGAEGKFAFFGTGTPLSQDPLPNSDGIPTIGLPRRKGNIKTLAPSNISDGHDHSTNDIDSSSSPDSSSETDDESDLSQNNEPSTALVSLKRKRARSTPGNSPVLSSEKALGSEQEKGLLKPEESVFLGNFLSTFSDWSIAGFFTLPENEISPSIAPRAVQVEVAQLVADQITQSSLDHKIDGKFGISCLDNLSFSVRKSLERSEYLDCFDKLDLNSLVSLQEQQNLFSPDASGGLTPLQNPRRKEPARGSITKISAPHLRVRRGKDFLETLPPAISFWETFGLEPACGSKDVIAYCIHPHLATKATDVFLERLSLAYTGCSFGSHARGENRLSFTNGLAEWNVRSTKLSTYEPAMQGLQHICEELGAALLDAPLSDDNIVVYIVNPFAHAASLVDICSAFYNLSRQHLYAEDKDRRKLDRVTLQIVPVDFVTSAESLVVPPQTEYLNLAMEVYSRCSTRHLQSNPVDCAPPVMLAENLPTSIGFKLASERSSPLQEGKCLHVACSKSQDQRWISVAWSDNSGALQRMMSYLTRFRNLTTGRTISAVRNEIWAATKDIMDKIQVRWRVIIVSTDNVDQDEYDTWLHLANEYNKSRDVPIELVILSVNTTSDLSLSPPPSPMPMNVLNALTSTTPAATPLPSGSILSPDQLGNAPTPPGGANAPANAPTPTDTLLESDSESLLTDISDESWDVVLSHRLNSTLHLTEYRPALASGFLLRRRGPTNADGAFSMSINLLFTQRPSSSYNTLLHEIIGMYRDLATLARVRGTKIFQSNTLPWHIASALRAQEVLSYVL
ncbi:mediator complex subunit 13 C-terminal-domain-containing protein [Aspergillus unguis]